jgi:hypothetical protein
MEWNVSERKRSPKNLLKEELLKCWNWGGNDRKWRLVGDQKC